jgi:hypothetical protein
MVSVSVSRIRRAPSCAPHAAIFAQIHRAALSVFDAALNQAEGQ